MNIFQHAEQLAWLIHKDLVIERRAKLAWTSMLLMGVMVAIVFSMQTAVPRQYLPGIAATILWLAILSAGMVAIDRAAIAEQQDGCWEALKLYPISASTVFLAKMTVNSIALLVLQCVLVPLFVILTDLPLLRHFGAMLLVSTLGSVGMAAVGTIASALTHGLRQRGTVLALLVLPLLVPLMLAGSEATRLLAIDDLGETWRLWVQFLAVFAVVFSTLGFVLFGCLMED